MKASLTYRWRGTIIVGVVLALLFLASTATFARANVSVSAPSPEQTADWWQWALAIPAVQNPIVNATPDTCRLGQSGPVWFLAATVGVSATSCTIPEGKAILIPA